MANYLDFSFRVDKLATWWYKNLFAGIWRSHNEFEMAQARRYIQAVPIPKRLSPLPSGGTHSPDSCLHTFLACRNAVMAFLFPQRGAQPSLVYILLQHVVIRGASFSEPKAFHCIGSTFFCRIPNLNPIEALERVATFEGYTWRRNFSKSC